MSKKKTTLRKQGCFLILELHRHVVWHGAWTQNFRAEHPENHGDMGHDQKESDEESMPLHLAGIVEVSADETKLEESNTTKWYHTEEVKEDSNNIGWSAPSSRSSERDDGACHQVEKNWNKIYSGGYACVAADFSHGPAEVSSEQEVEFANGNSFRQDNGNSHVDEEVPWLIGRQELHIVRHGHKKVSMNNKSTYLFHSVS